MYFSVPALLSLAAVAAAQHTYNLTQALTPGNFEKYRCLDTAKVNAMLPSCLYDCAASANRADGCAVDDYTCHCVNDLVYSAAIEPCAFPPSIGGNGTCTLQDLGKVRPVISGMCNFLNATLYATYAGCNASLSMGKTYDLLKTQETIAVGWPVAIKNGTVGNGTTEAPRYNNGTVVGRSCKKGKRSMRV